MEKRIKANVLNYVGRVTQPTLILNGELDFFFPPGDLPDRPENP